MYEARGNGPYNQSRVIAGISLESVAEARCPVERAEGMFESL